METKIDEEFNEMKLNHFVGMLIMYGYSVDSGETVSLGYRERYLWIKLRKKRGHFYFYYSIDCGNRTYICSRKNLNTGEEGIIGEDRI